MKFSLTLLFAFSVLVVGAQITLVPYDEPGKSGTKSILFEYVDEETGEKVKKEFDIQENNPFNSLMYKALKPNYDGSNVYALSASDRVQIINSYSRETNPKIKVLQKEIIDRQMIAKSHVFVDKTGINVLLAYNFFIYDSSGYYNNSGYGRFSSILALDEKGKTKARVDSIARDVYELKISENGRFLAYHSGDVSEYTQPGDVETGLIIMDLQNDMVLFENDRGASGLFVYAGMIVIPSALKEEKSTLILDQTDGQIYKSPSLGQILGYMKFIEAGTGSLIRINQLEKID